MDEDAALAVSAAPAGDRLYPSRPFLAASLAVLRDGRVLLARRAAAPFAGRYTLPGGLVEPGEALAAAALREMEEEVGVTARILGFNQHVEVVDRDEAGRVRHHYVIASFVGAWIAGEGMPGPEAAAIVWANRDEAARLPTTEHLPDLLAKAWAIAEAAA